MEYEYRKTKRLHEHVPRRDNPEQHMPKLLVIDPTFYAIMIIALTKDVKNSATITRES